MDIWSERKPMPKTWFWPVFGFDAAGHMSVAVTDVLSSEPYRTRFLLADLAPSGVWVERFEVQSTAADIPARASLAVGLDGAAAAVYTSATDRNESVADMRFRALYRPAGSTTWEEPTELGLPSPWNFVLEPTRSVRVSPNGRAVVLVGRSDPDANADGNRDGSILVSSHAPGGTWTTPQQVNPAGTDAVFGALGLDGSGTATIAWWRRGSGSSSIDVRTRDAASGELSSPSTIVTASEVPFAPEFFLDVNKAGTAVASALVGVHTVVTTRSSPTGSWQPVTAFSTEATADRSYPLAVGMSPGGTAYAMVMRRDLNGDNDDGMSRRLAGSSWEAIRPLAGPRSFLVAAKIAFRDDDAVASFATLDPPADRSQLLGTVWKANASEPTAPVDRSPALPGQDSNFGLQATPDNLDSVLVTDSPWSTNDVPTTYVATLDRSLPTKFKFAQPDPVKAAAFSADGTMLGVATGNTARVFSFTTGTWVRDVTHDGPVNAIEFLPDALSIATASDDGTARVTTIATGTKTAEITHGKPVVALAVHRNDTGQRLATAGRDGTARLLTINAGTQPRKFTHDEPVTDVVISPDGKKLATACEDRAARIFNAQTGATQLTLGQDGVVNRVVFNADGTRLATAGQDSTARVYNTANGQPTLNLKHGGPVRAVAFNTEATLLGTASTDGTVRIVTLGGDVVTLRHPSAANAVAFSANGRVATVTAENIAYVYDTQGNQQARLRHPMPVNAVALQPNGTQLATACDDKLARVFTIDQNFDQGTEAAQDNPEKAEQPSAAEPYPLNDRLAKRPVQPNPTSHLHLPNDQ